MRIWKQKSKEISDMKDIKKGDSVYVYSDTQNDFDGIVKDKKNNRKKE